MREKLLQIMCFQCQVLDILQLASRCGFPDIFHFMLSEVGYLSPSLLLFPTLETHPFRCHTNVATSPEHFTIDNVKCI
jgi:hypothetical protein